ncbi:hypothetical protein H4R34_003609 [Dimargaris verticillata]|uniref:G-patch domain-containing protein n=1 Tax=Dimargaris verticillata TaxID=2761393 RepID=A0A9W8B479_9FUNG|nr:hypothetical protein H4R34_003609 [Dimargaris verticillata]
MTNQPGPQASFAEAQLAKYGWKRGQGLGRSNDGIKKAVKVSRKSDRKGVGATNNDWGFAWWDHIYNKSARGIQVTQAEGDLQVKATQAVDVVREHKSTHLLSVAPPSPKTPANSFEINSPSPTAKPSVGLVFNMFVRATNQPASTESQKLASTGTPSTSSNSKSVSTPRDYSIGVTDAELFQACGGRTARKGARLLGQGDQGKLERTQTFATISTAPLTSGTSVQPEESSVVVEKSTAQQSKKRRRERQESKSAKKAKKDKNVKKKAKKSKRSAG